MTPEKENDLFEAIGAIKTGITNLNKLLEDHTRQDLSQFSDMAASVQAIDDKMTAVAKDLAVKEALAVEKEKQAAHSSNKRSTIVGTIAGFVASLITTWLAAHWGVR